MKKGDRLTINGVEVYVTWHSRDGRAFDEQAATDLASMLQRGLADGAGTARG